MSSAGLSISNQLAAEIFRHFALICDDKSAKEVPLELRHDVRRFAAKQIVVDMSRHVNVIRIFASFGSYPHGFFQPDRVEAL
jgi:hypothetical protein